MAADNFSSKYGPWALVAGGSEGLGSAFAEELAGRGMKLLLVARSVDKLGEISGQLKKKYDVEVKTLALDIAKLQDLQELIVQTKALEIGLLVCNAASAPIGEFLDLTAEKHQQIIDTNCRSAALLVHELAARMVQRGRGGIILVSSMAGFQGTAVVAHYAATKAYLRVLAEGLWTELKPKRVDVLACCAGIIDTPTYRRTNPTLPKFLSASPMNPRAVAGEALNALGKKPVMIPGFGNRMASLLIQRLLPKKLSVSLISSSTRKMYPKH